jgi:hypothetical protein
MGKKFSYLVKGSKRRLKTYAEEDDAGWICAFMWRLAALPNYEMEDCPFDLPWSDMEVVGNGTFHPAREGYHNEKI